MRIPIAHTLAWPERMTTPSPRLDLASLATLDFMAPDTERFPALRLARDALRAGGGAPAILNAANEVAVEAFMQRRIGFLDIAGMVADVLDAMGTHPANTLDEVVALDAAARRTADRLTAVRAGRTLQLNRKRAKPCPPCCTVSSHFSSCLACWSSCTSSATTSRRARPRACRGVLDRLRPGDRHLARPRRHGVEAGLAAARRLREAAWPGTSRSCRRE